MTIDNTNVRVQVSNSSDPNVPLSLEYRYTGYQNTTRSGTSSMLTSPGHGPGVQVGAALRVLVLPGLALAVPGVRPGAGRVPQPRRQQGEGGIT